MGRTNARRKVNGLRTHAEPARVRQEERVKIRKGWIVREKVWLDVFGNELDKLQDDPLTFHVRPPPEVVAQRKAPVIHGYPEPPPPETHAIELQFIPKKTTDHWDDTREAEEFWVALLLVVAAAVLLCMLWFLLGYWTGRRVAAAVVPLPQSQTTSSREATSPAPAPASPKPKEPEAVAAAAAVVVVATAP